MKICTKCRIEKELDEFHAAKYGKKGKASCCKICRKVIKKQWYKDNPGYYRKYYKENKEKVSKIIKRWQVKNKDRIAEYQKQWRKENPEYDKEWMRKTYKIPKNKISRNMSWGMWASLRDQKADRSWLSLVPYKIDELIKHLKKTLPTGYVWQDYLDGKLHIDHKIPISVFNFTKSEHIDFKKCWSLKNLQLLPAKENLSKQGKLSKPFQPSLAF